MCASGYRTPRSTSRIYMIATVKYGYSILEPGYGCVTSSAVKMTSAVIARQDAINEKGGSDSITISVGVGARVGSPCVVLTL